MRAHKIFYVLLLGTLSFFISSASLADDDSDSDSGDVSEFEDAFIRVEVNATDGDTEIVFGAKPDTDNGLKRFTVESPGGRKVVKVKSPKSVLGLREFLFESPEPAGDGILARYPEGNYHFSGKATDGEKFEGIAALSHEIPQAAMVTSPAQDSVISSEAITIEWSQIPDATQIILELEIESVDPAQVLLINLPAGTTSFEVPVSMLLPGADYQVGIGAVGENGNITFTENQFSTE